MPIALGILLIICVYLLWAYRDLNHRVCNLHAALHVSLRELDDQFDELGLIFSELREAPTADQVERAENGLIHLMDELMNHQERFQKAL